MVFPAVRACMQRDSICGLAAGSYSYISRGDISRGMRGEGEVTTDADDGTGHASSWRF